jgi:phospholipid/cholesterol/gamma-HCH transport system substrate-binding protein
MNQSPTLYLVVGIFVLIGLASIGFLSVSLGGASYRGAGDLTLEVTFDQIGGLKERAPVVVAGVKVGQITDVTLDEDLRARVRLEIDRNVQLPTDSSAAILTSGVLGDQYVELEPGAEENYLQPGDEITYTQNALVLERLIGKLVQNLGGGSG